MIGIKISFFRPLFVGILIYFTIISRNMFGSILFRLTSAMTLNKVGVEYPRYCLQCVDCLYLGLSSRYMHRRHNSPKISSLLLESLSCVRFAIGRLALSANNYGETVDFVSL